MCEKYIAWSHVSMNYGTSTAFFMQKTQTFCGSNGSGMSLVPLKNRFCIVCKITKHRHTCARKEEKEEIRGKYFYSWNKELEMQLKKRQQCDGIYLDQQLLTK